VRIALDLDPGVPLVMCDARDRESAKEVLITLVAHALTAPGAIPADSLEPAGAPALRDHLGVSRAQRPDRYN
jgi:uncharacterized protein